MDKKPPGIFNRQRQPREKIPLGAAEHVSRPLDCDLRFRVHALAGDRNGIVVIATNSEGALSDKIHRRLRAPVGVRAITNDITKQIDFLRAIVFRARKASLERLTIGMDIGKHCKQHVGLPH
jgi:hypothetical protein